MCKAQSTSWSYRFPLTSFSDQVTVGVDDRCRPFPAGTILRFPVNIDVKSSCIDLEGFLGLQRICYAVVH